MNIAFITAMFWSSAPVRRAWRPRLLRVDAARAYC